MCSTIKMFTSGRRPCLAFGIALTLALIQAITSDAVSSEPTTSTTPKTLNLNMLDLLRAQLLTNYDKNSHPTHAGLPTNITLGMSVNYIDIDELNGKIMLHTWLRVHWLDDNRSWNANDYDNITVIHMKAREVWKPDITLFNSAGEDGNYLGDTQVLLSNDGSFLWVPPASYKAYCNLNLQMWPYDTQTCSLRIGTWTTTNIDERSVSKTDGMDYLGLVQSSEWQILDYKMDYQKKSYYNYVEFTFVLKRQSSMYSAVIFTPASCIILLALSAFWLPPQMGEKILLNGIIIVVIAAFLMYFAQLLPILAENTPLVVLFYSSSLLLLSLSTIISVIVLYLSTSKHKRRLPESMRNVLNGGLGKILGLAHFTLEAEPDSLLNNGTKELSEHMYSEVAAESHDQMPDASSINPPTAAQIHRSIQFDWILLATAVDRIAFLLYCLAFIVLAIVYSV